MRRVALIAVAAAAAVVVALTLGWWLDGASQEGRVLRNVELAGYPAGGMADAELDALIATLDRQAATSTVTVSADDASFTVPASEIGLSVDKLETRRAALAAGREGALPARVWSWLLSPVRHRPARIVAMVDQVKLDATVAAKDTGARTPPKEPTIKGAHGDVAVIAGKPGTGIDPDEVAAKLRGAARDGFPIKVEVSRGRVDPRHSYEDAEQLASEAEELTRSPIKIAAAGVEATVDTPTLRSWLASRDVGGKLEIVLDPEKARADLKRLMPRAGTEAKETRFTVDGGEVKIIAGEAGTGCCADDSLAKILAALAAGKKEVRGLSLRSTEPEFTVAEARALKITEPIGTFTTNHPAGQPRVKNIHRIADLVRGAIIKPGATFSINNLVGKRTAEKGFVNAPVIEEGRFSEGVGGGVSQFATTLFNASFFGGLDFVEYQSHSIYLTRYPYGREATLNYPHPDLRIRNSTPYGVLIWANYSDTSITVTLYSTRFAKGEQTGQTTGSQGPCTTVRTIRTRTYSDGKTKTDSVRALYRPEEGVECK